MTTQFHDSLNLENLKKQAKSLLASVRSGDTAAFERVRLSHPEYHDKTPETLAIIGMHLADAQLTIARENGFASWPKLKKEAERVAAEAVKLQVDNNPRTAAEQLAALFSEFQSELTAPDNTGRTQLTQGQAIVRRLLSDGGPLDKATVENADKICFWQNDVATSIRVYQRYLEQPLSVSDEIDARYRVSCYLAMTGRASEAVQYGQELYRLTRLHLPAERLPWSVNNATLAACWNTVGRGGDWIAVCDEVLRDSPKVEANRMERFYLLRTRGVVLGQMGRTEEARAALKSVRFLADEDPAWSYRYSVLIRSIPEIVRYCRDLSDTDALRHAMIEGKRLLGEYEAYLSTIPNPDESDLRIGYDNIGHMFFWDKQYEEAISMLQKSLGPPERNRNAWGTGTLAAALWATRRNRQETLALLRHAAAVSNAGSKLDLTKVPEFADVLDDPEFVAVAAGQN